MTERKRTRCRERLARLAESDLDRDSLRFEAIADLQRTIGFDRWCWPLSDPDSLLPNSGLALHDYGPRVPRSLELEYSGDNYAAKHVVARRAVPAASLGLDTEGDLARSSRWDEVLRPVGIGDVAIAACRDSLGCWGWIEAYRDQADRRFDEQEVALLWNVAAALGSALRRSVVGPRRGDDGRRSPPGVVVLDVNYRPVSWTASAREWMDALPGAQIVAAWGMLPSIVYPAATLARSRPNAARSLVQAVDGRWVMIEAARLEGERDGEIAVNLRSARPSETFRLLCRAFALSRREREVVSLLVVGLDTRAVAKRLFISPHTVQDHLKSIFEKVGIHSRRELLATLGTADQPSA
ncbi:MAG TPA: LuxR C-terminal-related transcriptional regulator [Gaiellaceae bacterium]|nr:LuxR C-terminal-related transcriptional regulator [Gaiellaceae bacterium]